MGCVHVPCTTIKPVRTNICVPWNRYYKMLYSKKNPIMWPMSLLFVYLVSIPISIFLMVSNTDLLILFYSWWVRNFLWSRPDHNKHWTNRRRMVDRNGPRWKSWNVSRQLRGNHQWMNHIDYIWKPKWQMVLNSYPHKQIYIIWGKNSENAEREKSMI